MTAPAQLTQNYYDCYPTASSAFFNALGIASGNTQLVVPLTVLATIPLIYLFLVLIRRVPPKEEYTALEKEEVMEIVSIILLRLRDGKTRGFKKNGVLVKLTKELIKAAKEEVGYPDSDDDEEEDSDAEPEAVEEEEEEDDDDEDDGEDDDEGEEENEDDEGGSRRPTGQTPVKRAVTIDSDDEVIPESPTTAGTTSVTTTAANSGSSSSSSRKKGTTGKKTTKKSSTKTTTTTTKKRKKRTSTLPVDYDPWQTTDFKPKKASKLSVFTRQLEDDGVGGGGVGGGGSGTRRRPTAAGGDTDGQGPGGDDTGYYPGKYLISTARLMRDNVQKQAHQHLVAHHRPKHRAIDSDSDDDVDADGGVDDNTGKRNKHKKTAAGKTTTKAKSRAAKALSTGQEPPRFSVTDGATEMTVFQQQVPSTTTAQQGSSNNPTSSSIKTSSNPMHDDVETGTTRPRRAPKLVFRIIAHEGIPHGTVSPTPSPPHFASPR